MSALAIRLYEAKQKRTVKGGVTASVCQLMSLCVAGIFVGFGGRICSPTLPIANFIVRRSCNGWHSYATMCPMAGMNPAFITNQLGHSVQGLLSTDAQWLDSSTHWSELGTLDNSLIGTTLARPDEVPL